MINFEIPIEPLPQSRPRFSRGKVYELPRIKAFKAAVGTAARAVMKDQQPTDKAVSCNFKFYRKFKPSSRRFADIDNLIKSVADSLNGIIWRDDSQIVSIIAEKIKSDSPRLEVLVTEV